MFYIVLSVFSYGYIVEFGLSFLCIRCKSYQRNRHIELDQVIKAALCDISLCYILVPIQKNIE